MLDPATQTFRNACREARIVVAVWFIALIWTVSYCYVNGYPHAPDNVLVQLGLADERPAALTRHRFGMPFWVCWGIVAPAIGCTLFTVYFGLFVMKDDALGIEKES